MKISIIATGHRPPAWADAGFEEYAKRLPPHLRPNSVLVDAASRRRKSGDKEIARQAALEGEHLLRAAGAAKTIALDRGGRAVTTDDFAKALADWQMEGRDIAFLIGGADGLAPTVLEQSDLVWSLSNLVFAHHLVRVLLAEQLYRAWSISQGSPYHRGEAVAASVKRGSRSR